MRVVLLGPSHPLRGGIAHYNARLFRAVQTAGHEVALLGMHRQYPAWLFPGRTQEDTSREPVEVPSEHCLDTLDPRTWWRTARRVEAFEADVVVIQWWHPWFSPSIGTIARIIAFRTRARVVFLCHNARPHEASALDDLLLRYAFAPAHGFVVHAEAESARLADFLAQINAPAPIEVAPHPVYDVFSTTADSSPAKARAALGLTRPHQLLFFGFVRPYKGLDVLLEAMPRILSRIDGELTIAGECYGDAAPYRARIKGLGLEDRVHWLDHYIPNEDVSTLFEAADVCVLPYRSATQSGIAQVSYGLDTPVIASRVGGIPEVVEDGHSGLLVPPEDPKALAEAVIRFFEEGLREPLTQGLRQVRGTLSWERIVSAIERLSRQGS